MITADAIKLVNAFGARREVNGFLECIEAMDELSKLPESVRQFHISDAEVEAYKIVIGEMEQFAGAV